MTFKIDYLDLALQYLARKIIILDSNNHNCYLRTKHHKQCLHSETPHLNTITDLLMSLGTSLEAQQKHNKNFEQVSSTLAKQLEKTEDLKQNIEYLKNLQEDLNLRFGQLNFINLPTRRDILSLSILIEENKPRDFELKNKQILIQIKEIL